MGISPNIASLKGETGTEVIRSGAWSEYDGCIRTPLKGAVTDGYCLVVLLWSATLHIVYGGIYICYQSRTGVSELDLWKILYADLMPEILIFGLLAIPCPQSPIRGVALLLGLGPRAGSVPGR